VVRAEVESEGRARAALVSRRRQVTQNAVEQRVDALVLEGRSHEDGAQLPRDRLPAHGGVDGVFGDVLLRQEEVCDLIVNFGEPLDELRALLRRRLDILVRDGRDAQVLAVGSLEKVGTLLHEVDHAHVVFGQPHRDLHRRRVQEELLTQRVNHHVRVGALAVELVDECEPRYLVAAHLAVDGDRLRLDTRDAAEHQDRAVQHPQRPLHLDREVDVARRVDDVDLVPVPTAVRRGRLDGDALLALEVHRIHLGAHTVLAAHVVDRVDLAREVEDPLGQCRLARVDVR